MLGNCVSVTQPPAIASNAFERGSDGIPFQHHNFVISPHELSLKAQKLSPSLMGLLKDKQIRA